VIEQQADQLRAAAEQRDRAFAAIREVDGCGSFPKATADLDGIRQAACDAPIAYVAPGHSEGSLLLVQPDGAIKHRSLPVALSVVSSQHSGPFDPEGPSHHQSVRASV
jgi:hypothetical protein